MLTMIPVTRAHGLEKFELKNVGKKIRKVAEKGRVADIIGGRFSAGAWVTFTLTHTAFVATAVYFCFKGIFTVGDVVMFSAFFARLSGSISGVLHTMPEISKIKESIISIREVLDAPDKEVNQGKAAVEALTGGFNFRDVTFFYPDTDEAGVRNLNLKVEPGESIAFVGKSGCGKSTTLSLILGFIRPVAGQILLDGKDMEILDLRQYRQHVGVVTQDTVFFSSTIRDNVAYGMPGIHEEHVLWALERAQALDFINELPEGIETRIGADGVNLSGGQRQRLSIARALIRDPKVLLFDEATSALDVQTEAVLQDVLEELMRNRTTFIVSHRFSTIRNADRIVVMDNGEIVQEGSHHLLMEQDNYYSRSVRLQLVG
jgi:ATP-binding cassette subfamily B protein